MAVNQVIVGDEVKLDLTTDTVSEETLLEGVTAHNAAGEPIVGTMSSGSSGGGGGGTTYSPGDGVSISDRNEISARIDGETIQFDEDGKMYVPTVPLALENAIVIQEKDAAYILHNYTTVEYIAGNRIGYAKQPSDIITNGYLVRPLYYDTSRYTDMTFSLGAVNSNTPTANFKVRLEIYQAYSEGYTDIRAHIGETYYSSTYRTYDMSKTSIALTYEYITPPNNNYPYGSAYMKWAIWYIQSNGSETWGATGRITVGFASEAEYNAAVGLTYEPNTLTMIVDNKEVTG